VSASEWAIYSVFIVENLILAAVMAWLAGAYTRPLFGST
jgi:hypothetical protein